MTIISWIIEKAQHSLDFFDTLTRLYARAGPLLFLKGLPFSETAPYSFYGVDEMTNVMLNTQLYQKMYAEQAQY